MTWRDVLRIEALAVVADAQLDDRGVVDQVYMAAWLAMVRARLAW